MNPFMQAVKGKTVTLIPATPQANAIRVTVTMANDHGVYVTYSTGAKGYMPWTSIVAVEWE